MPLTKETAGFLGIECLYEYDSDEGYDEVDEEYFAKYCGENGYDYDDGRARGRDAQCDYADEHNDALAKKNDGDAHGMEILEINIDDLALAFALLRDRMDYRRFVSQCVDDKEVDTGYLTEHEVTRKERYSPVSEDRLLLSIEYCDLVLNIVY